MKPNLSPRIALAVLFLATATQAAAAADGFRLEPGYLSLFNGKDLTWKGIAGKWNTAAFG